MLYLLVETLNTLSIFIYHVSPHWSQFHRYNEGKCLRRFFAWRQKVRAKFVRLRNICKRFSFECHNMEIIRNWFRLWMMGCFESFEGYNLRMILVPNHSQMISPSKAQFLRKFAKEIPSRPPIIWRIHSKDLDSEGKQLNDGLDIPIRTSKSKSRPPKNALWNFDLHCNSKVNVSLSTLASRPSRERQFLKGIDGRWSFIWFHSRRCLNWKEHSTNFDPSNLIVLISS